MSVKNENWVYAYARVSPYYSQANNNVYFNTYFDNTFI